MTSTTDEMLYAKPASVHFGGFELERSVQQRVRVHNNSAKAVRLRYTFPTGKKGFRATFANVDRPSFVSAGLCEEILVSFTPPAGFQYYYDCIQVQCEEVAYGSSTDVARSGATLIPLHAYPMVNEVAFPTRMDFGVVARGTCARKFVDITCSVPVEFEYEIHVTKPHPAFTVFPLTGTIPPRGSSSSTAVDMGIATVEVTEQKLSSPTSPTSKEKPGRPSEAQTKSTKANTPRSETKTRSKKHTKEEPQFDEVDDEEDLEKVRGVEIPRNLSSVTGVTFVLNQKPGKLKPKDLKKAIAKNRALQQQQREEQAKLSTGSAQGDEDEDAATLSFQTLVREEEGYLEKVRVSKQVKDMFFLQELREVAEAEKTLEFQSHKVHLGQRLLSHVWNVANTTVPLLTERAEDIPSLSDSESDEDGGIEEAHISWMRALELESTASSGIAIRFARNERTTVTGKNFWSDFPSFLMMFLHRLSIQTTDWWCEVMVQSGRCTKYSIPLNARTKRER
ncbi:hypothetical protein JG687_00004945 [Phytophthora cactorum]|uniref:Uncharacterized protein n=1 Tax=Phytophthora cactorum TaxID=29920 RepID=A0A8T1UMC9_9STRA|nr:hypothetical protein JG687_00004945 [Phytophthora cactorum]